MHILTQCLYNNIHAIHISKPTARCNGGGTMLGPSIIIQNTLSISYTIRPLCEQHRGMDTPRARLTINGHTMPMFFPMFPQFPVAIIMPDNI